MADADVAGNPVQLVGPEHIGHESHAPMRGEFAFEAADDARAFLAPVLQGVQAQVNEFRRFRMVNHTEYAAFLAGVVVIGEREMGAAKGTWA